MKRYRITFDKLELISRAGNKLFILYTRHKVGDKLNLLVNGNDIGLICEIVKNSDSMYKFCRIISHKYDLSFYDKTRPEIVERTNERLSSIFELGMHEVGICQFGISGICSGLYIEYVWKYTDEQFNEYLDFVKDCIDRKKEK